MGGYGISQGKKKSIVRGWLRTMLKRLATGEPGNTGNEGQRRMRWYFGIEHIETLGLLAVQTESFRRHPSRPRPTRLGIGPPQIVVIDCREGLVRGILWGSWGFY